MKDNEFDCTENGTHIKKIENKRKGNTEGVESKLGK